jgi:predicted nucleotidyltransferase
MDEISFLKIGQNKLVFLKNILTSDIFVAENNRLNKFLKLEDIRNISRKLNKICSPFFIALLFGSRIKSKQFNDIDLCIISDDKKVISDIEDELGTLSYRLDLNIFDVNEFKEMISSKNSNLGNEILKKNIVLKGIENYYDLLKCHQSGNEKLKDSSDESKKRI